MEIKLTIKIEGLDEFTNALKGIDFGIEELANTIRSRAPLAHDGFVQTLPQDPAPQGSITTAAVGTGSIGEVEVRIEDEKPTPAKETKKKPVAETPKPTAKATKEEIATALATVAKRDGNNLKVAEFLRNHGATKMSDLDPTKFNYDDLLAQAKAL